MLFRPNFQDSFVFRILQSGLFLDFWEDNEVASRCGYLLSAYFSYFQCFAHVVIGLNRFTCFAYPEKYKKVATPKNNAFDLAVLF